jgi:hypothetical protein
MRYVVITNPTEANDMAKAVVPIEFPALPTGAIAWSRSTKRHGSMFHAHLVTGDTVCRSMIIDFYNSKKATELHEFKYWGACPRCLAKVDPAVQAFTGAMHVSEIKPGAVWCGVDM